jgi:uncharacterized protein
MHSSENPSLMAALEDKNYRASIERAIVIYVEAIEWNCPQHITPRFTEEEVHALITPIAEENQQLKLSLKCLNK